MVGFKRFRPGAPAWERFLYDESDLRQLPVKILDGMLWDERRHVAEGRAPRLLFEARIEQIERARQLCRGQLVYFIAAGKRVKIGCAFDPTKRLQSLQTANAEPLRLLGIMPGGRAQESQLHQKFERYRISGEWFRYEEWLRGFARRQFGDGAP